MRARKQRAGAGFTLIETMIATSIGIAVLAGTMAVGLQLQRQGIFEEQKTIAQDSASALRGLLSPMVIRAGAGMGNSRINIGANDYSYPLNVITDANDTSDSSFALPSGAYAALTSDSLELFWGTTNTLVNNVDCNGTGAYRGRSGANVCVPEGSHDHFDGKLIFISNPSMGVSCMHTVTQIPSDDRLQTNPGGGANPPPADEPCADANSGFWGAPGAQVMELSASRLRVNWKSGAPVLEFDPDGRVGNQPWQVLSRGVERLKFRLGIKAVNLPNAPIIWYPDADSGRPAIDDCTAATCDVPDPGVAPGLLAAELTAELDGITDADQRIQARLMKRVRVVEVILTARSPRSEREQVREVTNGVFAVDAENQLMDGFKRRTYSFQLAPRNFALF